MSRPQGSAERRALIDALQDNLIWAAPGQDPCMQDCIYWWVEFVDPKTEKPNLLAPQKNILMMIHLEVSPWDGQSQRRDETLDCWGFGLEDCLIDLALKINLRASLSGSSEGSP